MKRNRKAGRRRIATAILLLTLFTGVGAVPGQAGAMAKETPHVYLLARTDLYNKPDPKAKPVASLAPGQFVSVVGSDLGEERGWEDQIEWLQIKTWIGNKWIKADAERLTSGSYQKLDQTLTLLAPESPLYDQPDSRYSSNRTMKPQMLRASASFEYYPIHFESGISLIMSLGNTWYRVDTPHGAKWLLNPAAPEVVKETPLTGTFKLTGQEKAYPYPFQIEGAAQTIEPQAVQALAEWTDGVGPGEVHWLKVRLPEGDRWITPSHPVWTDYKVIDETIVLLTDARYYSGPAVDLHDKSTAANPDVSKDLLKAGSYEAFEAAGEWVHIRTKDHGDVWVNPELALLERPVGTVPTDEEIELAKSDEYYAYPNSPDRVHPKGFYKPQTVKAFEKWTAEDGTV